MTSLTFFFFFKDPATTEIYTLSLHDALPISQCIDVSGIQNPLHHAPRQTAAVGLPCFACLGLATGRVCRGARSEEHTSELQSRFDLVCRLLLEKKKKSRL